MLGPDHPDELNNSRATLCRQGSYRHCKSQKMTRWCTVLTFEIQGNGFNSSSIPVYQSETCGGHIRGALVCLNSTITIVGLVIVSATAYLLWYPILSTSFFSRRIGLTMGCHSLTVLHNGGSPSVNPPLHCLTTPIR